VQAEGATAAAGRNGTIVDRNVTEVKDHVDAFKWTTADLTRDGEYMCAGADAKDKHIIYIWQAQGGIPVRVLEGPPIGLQACSWLPDPSRCAAQALCAVSNHIVLVS
jgi:hypothetical protein